MKGVFGTFGSGDAIFIRIGLVEQISFGIGRRISMCAK